MTICKPVVRCALCDQPIPEERVLIGEESTPANIKLKLVPIAGRPGIFCDCVQSRTYVRESGKEDC